LQALQAQQALQQAQETVGLQQAMAALNCNLGPIALTSGNLTFDGPSLTVGGSVGGDRMYGGGGGGGFGSMFGDGGLNGGYGGFGHFK
jgi:hypothetical protein